MQKLEAIMDDPNFENPKECTGSSLVVMGEKGKYRCVNVSPGGAPKPKNGECPVCGTSAFVTRKDEIDNFWKSRGDNEPPGIWNVWEWRGRNAQVQCRNCNVMFVVVERTDAK